MNIFITILLTITIAFCAVLIGEAAIVFIDRWERKKS